MVLSYPGWVNILVNNYLTRGFWGDEAWTALISALPIKEIIRVTGEDFHPPAYYLLVHWFIALFGASEWIRLISTFFWLLTPIPVYWLVKNLKNKTVAMLGAALVLTSPILFIYAFEARSYALLAFESSLSTLAFWNSVKDRSNRWNVIYVLTAIVGVYTHYYMWFILASHGIYWLLWERNGWKKYSIIWGSILVAQLPWVPMLLAQASSVARGYWIAPIDKWWTHWEWFVRVAAGDNDVPQRMFIVWIILSLLIMSLVVVRLKEKLWPKAYIFLWSWLVVPVLIPSVISLFRPIFFYRYLIFSTVPILLIVLWGLAAIRKALAWGGAAFILVFYISINGFNFMRFPYSMREELNKVWLDENHQNELVVTVLPAFAEVMFYVAGRVPVQVLPLGIIQSSGKSLLDAYVRAGKVKVITPKENQSYWLVEPGPKLEWHEMN